MKFAYAAISLAASLAGVSAQDVSGIPTCAYACFVTALATTSCSATDVLCQCTTGSAAIAKAATPCIAKACSPEDALQVQPATEAICSKYLDSAGVTTTAAAAAASGTDSSSSKTSPAAAAAHTNAASPLMASEYMVAVVVAAGALVL